MLKKFLLLASLLPALAFGHGAPVIWNGTNAAWLPSGLKSAGVCKLSATGVMTSGTVSDSELGSSYVLANGSRALSSSWNAGQNITAPAFIGDLTGNASTATALASNPSDCAAGTVAVAIAANGNLTCAAVSLTADVSGILPMANGGTAKNMTAVNGGIVYSDSDSLEVTSAGTSGRAVLSGGAGAPTFFAPTVGSVLFAGASGILDEENSVLFYDKTNDRLGIGTATPSGTLDVTNVGDSIRGNIVLWGQGRAANSEWLIYDSPIGDVSLYNPNQGVYGWSCRAVGGCSIGTYALGSGNQMLGIKNNAGETAKSTLAMELVPSQTGDFLTAYANGQGSVLAKITASGAATFTGATIGSGSGLAVLTSGVVSAVTPSDCSAGDFVKGINADGSLDCATPSGGSSTLTVSVETGDNTLTNSDDVILANCSTPCTQTMQAVAGATVKPYRIKNIGTATVTIEGDGSETFDRTELNITLPPGGLPQSAVTIIPDTGGSSWAIF